MIADDLSNSNAFHSVDKLILKGRILSYVYLVTLSDL